MIDPEVEYRRIVSGDAARVRSGAEELLYYSGTTGTCSGRSTGSTPERGPR